jgi:hypothetical protein
MSLKYLSGVEVQADDRILYHGEAGRVEFVAVVEGESAWYAEQFGVGCMLAVPSFGLVYVRPDEHLEFIDRGVGL